MESAEREVGTLARKVQTATLWTFDLGVGGLKLADPVRHLAFRGFDLAGAVENLARKGFDLAERVGDLADSVGSFERSTWRTACRISFSGGGLGLRDAWRYPLTLPSPPTQSGEREPRCSDLAVCVQLLHWWIWSRA